MISTTASMDWLDQNYDAIMAEDITESPRPSFYQEDENDELSE